MRGLQKILVTLGSLVRSVAGVLWSPLGRLSAFATLLILWGAIPNKHYEGVVMSGVGLFAVIAIMTFVQASKNWRHRRAVYDWRTWFIAPMMFIVLVYAIWIDVPGRLGFLVSKPAMERLAYEVSRSGVDQTEVRAGVLWFYSVRLEDEGRISFHHPSMRVLLWGKHGYYFTENGEAPEDSSYDVHEPLGDGWFTWRYSGW